MMLLVPDSKEQMLSLNLREELLPFCHSCNPGMADDDGVYFTIMCFLSLGTRKLLMSSFANYAKRI